MTETTAHTVPATLVTYRFDTSKPEEAAQYHAMAKTLYGRKCLSTYSSGKGPVYETPKSGTQNHLVRIETKCIFGDQWNTDTARVFDWFECIFPNAHYKQGHYIELSPELLALRVDTLKCGYCGQHYGPNHAPAPADGFCAACYSSEYLKEKDLPLLRLLPAGASFGAKRPPLTDDERAAIMPRHVAGRVRMLERKKQATIARNAEKLASAREEHAGMLWFLDNGVDTDYVIYYHHKRKFCIDWREGKPMPEEERSHAVAVICEFPYDYYFRGFGD